MQALCTYDIHIECYSVMWILTAEYIQICKKIFIHIESKLDTNYIQHKWGFTPILPIIISKIMPPTINLHFSWLILHRLKKMQDDLPLKA